MAYLRDRRAFGNIGTRKFRGARFGDALSPRGPQYTLEGRVLDYSTDVGPFTIVDQSGESNTATLYSGRGLTMDAVNDTVTYATGYSLGSQTATVWMRVDTLGTRALGSTAGGGFLFTPTATGVWEELTYTRSNVEGDLLWLAGSDCDIGDLRVGTEHWTHNDWSDPSGNTSNGKTIVDSGPNQLHGTCVGCSGFTGEGIDPEVAGIVGLDDARWFNGVDTKVTSGAPISDVGAIEVKFIFSDTEGVVFLSQQNGVALYGLSITQSRTAGNVHIAFHKGSSAFEFISQSGFSAGELITATAFYNFTTSTFSINVNGGTGDGTLIGRHAPAASLNLFQIGANGNDTFFTNGIISDLKEYDTDQVTAIRHYTGLGNTPWVDTIGSNDGTESGTFVSVGQKRATIPQTADKNWNKYSWFNGVDTEVSLGDVLDMGTGDFYLEVEATFKSTGVTQGILSKGKNAGGNAGYDLRINDDGTIGFVLRTASTTTLCVGATTLTDGQRYLIRVEATRGGVSEIYLDGVLDGTEDISGLGASSVSNALPFHLGRTTSNSNLYQFPYTGVLTSININGQAAYTGLGNDPWKDTIGTNDGTEAGTFTRELVTASDANIQIDALGTAILEPRLNTQQLNLFGDGEYSSTPDSASLDLTTTATWEVWGNFYGATTSNQFIISKQDGAASKQSFTLIRAASDPAGELRIVTSSTGTTVAVSQVTGLTDSINHVVVTHNGATWAAYVDGIATTITGTTPVSSLYVNDVPVSLGARPSNGVYGNFAPFKIGSAKIYNVALTADEVLTNYNTQKSLYGL
jgi:hypothetical protein